MPTRSWGSMMSKKQQKSVALTSGVNENSAAFGPHESLPHQLSVIVNRVSEMLQRMYATEFGLTVAGWRALAVLGGNSPISAKELGHLLVMDQVSISRTVDQLVKLGFVIRAVDSADRRRVALSLSNKGAGTYDRIVPLLNACDHALTAGLNQEDNDKFRELSREIARRSELLFGDGVAWSDIIATYSEENFKT